MSTITRNAVGIAALVLLILLSGCTGEQIARAEHAVAAADAGVDRAEQAARIAEQALTQASALAEQVGSQQARDAVAAAQQAVALAQAAIPAAREVAAQAHAALDAAKAAQAAGGSTFDMLMAVAVAAIPGLGVIAKMRGTIQKLHTAVRLTADHGDRMERAETADDVVGVKKATVAAQADAGVLALVAAIRGKPIKPV